MECIEIRVQSEYKENPSFPSIDWNGFVRDGEGEGLSIYAAMELFRQALRALTFSDEAIERACGAEFVEGCEGTYE